MYNGKLDYYLKEYKEKIMSKKFYAIKKGKKPGIYTTWPEAQKQIHGFSKAQFKSFSTRKEAEEYINPPEKVSTVTKEDTVQAYVDGSFDKHAKRYSYGVVLLKNNKILEKLSHADNDKKYTGSYQIAGECFGSLNAIKWAKEHGYKRIIVHYDYMGVEMWATRQWKAKKAVSKDYVMHFDKLTKDIEVEFVKVKAHSGIEMNELADELAKNALK